MLILYFSYYFCGLLNISIYFIVMDYISRGELFSAWKHYHYFSEEIVQIYIAEIALVLGMFLSIL